VAGTPNQDLTVVDSHVHIFSPDVIQSRERLVQSDRWFGELYRNEKAGLVTFEDLIHSMDLAGIDVSIACGFPWSDPGLCRDHNDYLHAVHNTCPARVGWLATVVPPDPGAPQEAERCFRNGAVGIGELNADGQGFDLRDPDRLAPLVEVCQAYHKPLMFHVSEPVGHRYPGKGTATPERLLTFLERFPEVSVIAAHWGGGLPFYELMPEVARTAQNVVYDSAATTYLYRFPVFRTAIDLVGPERVLFASDYPVLRQDRLRRRVDRLGLLEDTARHVMGDNAVRVFGLRQGRQ
jgi:uncharacterized protein